ncbi:hypothetical protein IQ219_02590 [Synechocystis sp. LEGE 06083]|nr:hypothetical protein [Synechocystis sp. LEGE 06083]
MWRNKQFTFDIALEFYSDFDRKIPGWVCKPLDADYIAYAVLPLGQAVLLPVPQLQQAWLKHSAGWLEKFFIAQAKNKGYTTHSVCVPLGIVFSAIGANFRATCKPIVLED